MTVLRAFIALEIPAEIKKALELQTANLRQRAGSLVRWVSPENTHLTLKFLGDIPAGGVEALAQAIQAVCSQQSGFEITTGGVGCFPNLRQPCVIWIGLEDAPELFPLQARLDAATAALGYPAEARVFSAHLTIGRVREQITPVDLKKLIDILAEKATAGRGSFPAQYVTLFKSELRPDGPRYSALFRAQMGN